MRVFRAFKVAAALKALGRGDRLSYQPAELRDFEVGTVDEFPPGQIRKNVLLLVLHAIGKGQLTDCVAELSKRLGCNLVAVFRDLIAEFLWKDEECLLYPERTRLGGYGNLFLAIVAECASLDLKPS